MTRWIAQSVDMLDHPVVGMDVPPPPAADKSRHAQPPLVAWQDLLRHARWVPGDVHHKQTVVRLGRGQFLAGRAHWAKRWNWGEQSVRSFFARLVENDMIVFCNQSKGHTANIASICNYEKYQSTRGDAQPEQKPEVNQSPTRGQPEVNQNNTKNTLPSVNAGAHEDAKIDGQVAALNEALNRLKTGFNGQTDLLVADTLRWLGPSAKREHAISWLNGTLAACGELATLEAHKMLVADMAGGSIVARPLVKWSKTASTLKAKGVVAKAEKPLGHNIPAHAMWVKPARPTA